MHKFPVFSVVIQLQNKPGYTQDYKIFLYDITMTHCSIFA